VKGEEKGDSLYRGDPHCWGEGSFSLGKRCVRGRDPRRCFFKGERGELSLREIQERGIRFAERKDSLDGGIEKEILGEESNFCGLERLEGEELEEKEERRKADGIRKGDKWRGGGGGACLPTSGGRGVSFQFTKSLASLAQKT